MRLSNLPDLFSHVYDPATLATTHSTLDLFTDAQPDASPSGHFTALT
jgi:hypothetical protein